MEIRANIECILYIKYNYDVYLSKIQHLFKLCLFH